MSNPIFAQIVVQDFAVPEGCQPEQFVTELLELLGDPNPIVRDKQAYSILATWIEHGLLDKQLVALGDACASSLKSPSVLMRSFGALILGECLQRGRQTGLLSKTKAYEWIDSWAQWYPNEQDVRSFEEGTGWIHAVAHGADVAAIWALWPLTGDELQALAEVIEARLRSLPHYLNQTEDDRIALALLAIFSQPNFDTQQLRTWSIRYRTIWENSPAKDFPPSTIVALRTLHSLHTLLYMGAIINEQRLKAAHQIAAIEVVQDTLKSFYPYYQ